MMKKILFILFLGFILGGCRPKNNEYQYKVQATTMNIEKYYQFSSIMNLTNDGYELMFLMEPKVELVAKDVKVEIEYYVSYFDFSVWKHQRETITLIASKNLPTTQTVSKTDAYGVTYADDITFGEILNVSGTIMTNIDLSNDTIDITTNKNNYNQFMETVEKYESDNKLSITSSTTINFFYNHDLLQQQTNKTEIEIQTSPFYYETTTLLTTTVIFEKEGHIFSYIHPENKINGKYNIDLEYLGEVSELDSLINIDTYETVNINYYKTLIEKDDNVYTLSGSFNDIVNDKTLDDVKQIFLSSGIEEEELKKMSFVIKYIFDDNKITTVTIMTCKHQMEVFDKIEVTSTKTYLFSDISIIDIYDTSLYYVKKANKPKEALTITDVTKLVTSEETANPHYYYIYLEGGQYFVDTEIKDIRFTFYTKALEKVDVGNVFQNIHLPKINKTFTIPEGYYYLKVETNNLDSYQFKITKLNYDTEVDFKNPQLLSEGDFNIEIEGAYDIIYLNYYASRPGILYINGKNDKNVYIAHLSELTYVEENLDNNHFLIKRGNNYFYIYGDTNVSTYQISFIPLNK